MKQATASCRVNPETKKMTWQSAREALDTHGLSQIQTKQG